MRNLFFALFVAMALSGCMAVPVAPGYYAAPVLVTPAPYYQYYGPAYYGPSIYYGRGHRGHRGHR